MDLYLPAFPALSADLTASQAAVQMTLTVDVVGIIVGQLVLGPLSDRWGRRLLLGATAVCAASSLLCALAPSVGLLIGARFVHGFSGGGGSCWPGRLRRTSPAGSRRPGCSPCS
jgi:DHA1 family bicyclomycin/chloramphenicol resistance-like MFS transporter